MKKVISLFAFTLVLICSAQAQPFFRTTLGLTRYHYKFSSSYQDYFIQTYGATYESQSRTGFEGGLGFGMQLGSRAALLIEGYYMQKGSTWTTKENYTIDVKDRSGNTSTVLGFPVWHERINAIHVPVMVRVKPFGERFGPTIAVGPSFNFAFSGKGDNVIETQDKTYPNGDYELSFGQGRTNDYSNFDMSLNIRPGFVFNIDEEGIMKLALEADFSIGLKDMVTQDRKDFQAANGIDMLGTQKNRGVAFQLSFEICPWCE